MDSQLSFRNKLISIADIIDATVPFGQNDLPPSINLMNLVPYRNYSCSLKKFVAVKTKLWKESIIFWIGLRNKIFKNSFEVVSQSEVLWFDTFNNKDFNVANYGFAKIFHWKKIVSLWKDDVSMNTVTFTFPKLTKFCTQPVSVQKQKVPDFMSHS